MSVDPYAICPCGNGKKIKFCKCKDSVGQMDQVLKMVEGGQIVPALDRLRSILDEHSDAAWALAIRGRLLISLQEFDSLADNAERFIRLQPSNPLALTQRAAVSVAKGEMQVATDSLLEAFNESGQNVDSFLMDVAMLVAMGLVQNESILSARLFAMLPLGASGYDSSDAGNFMNQLDSSPMINHLLKHIPDLIECQSGVDWQERYDEAIALLDVNKVLLAQDKFESLRRTAPGQAAVLSGLLRCAIWRGDVDRQAEMAQQLSQVEALDLLERQRYGAIAALLKERDVLAVESANVRADFNDIDQAEMALSANSRVRQMEPAQLARLKISDDSVPPRSAFFVGDRELPDSSEDTAGADAPVNLCIACVYGRQTDQGPHVIAYDVAQDQIDDVKSIFSEAIPEGEITVGEPLPTPLMVELDLRPVRVKDPTSMAEMTKFNREFAQKNIPVRAASIKLPLFEGKSLGEIADDDSKAMQRGIYIRILEGQERLQSLDGVLDAIREIAKVDALPPLKPANEEANMVNPADLFRIDASDSDCISLYYLASSARQVGAREAARKFAALLVEKQAPTAESAEEKQLVMEGYLIQMMSIGDPQAAFAMGSTATEYAKANQLNFAPVLLMQMELCLMSADQDGFRSTIMEIEKNYGNDPAVMARVQQVLVQLGVIRPDGSLRAPQGAPGPAPGNDFVPAPAPQASGGQSSEGLWTPDSPGESNSGGGGKLWVPGMD
ncbi:protein-disulfide isomerase [Stieleria sp. JC731]|uniref:tetratricopeptide repeat protein n=1 Tax=Pirellulaceae TaxID=2691357 RepID=UPI001E56DB30|nr:protein-disulfide isomerase [Stieleria sp. JC731]MCC9600121.1 protein-disulfide isomerase [Stieleria sp. JC731]